MPASRPRTAASRGAAPRRPPRGEPRAARLLAGRGWRPALMPGKAEGAGGESPRAGPGHARRLRGRGDHGRGRGGDAAHPDRVGRRAAQPEAAGMRQSIATALALALLAVLPAAAQEWEPKRTAELQML